jgi:1-acyl-sn-glycerol-3-phosphate acyltransferase
MVLDVLRNGVSYIIFFSYCALLFLPLMGLLYLPFSWGWVKTVYGGIMKVSAKFLLFATFLPVTYQGMNELPQQPAIFVANHQSALDIPLLASVLGARESVWLATSELMGYPFLGKLLSHSGLPVYPKDPANVGRTGVVQAAVEKLQQGVSIVLFPEGARYMDGIIHPFFTGFAAMAKVSGAPVVPLFISGTGIALPSGARLIKRYPLMITVGKPFVCEEGESVQAFKERVENWFIELNWRRNYLLEHYGIRICNETNLLPELLNLS